MPFSGGSFSLYTPGNPTITGTTISSSWANNTLADIATGLSTAILKDGTQTVTANIPMSGYKFTGLAAGTTAGDSVRYEQVLLLTGGTVTGATTFSGALTVTGGLSVTTVAANFADNMFFVVGSSDATKKLAFEVDGFTTGVTRTLTAPNYDATIATLAGTETLTNKTLTSAVLNTAVTGTAIADSSAMAAMTANNLIVTPNSQKLILDTEKASTSGTSVDFTGIPSGVRRITIMLVGVSTNGTDNYLLQLGDSGGFENSGYTSACNAVGTATNTSSSGFLLTPGDVQAAAAYHGRIVLTLENASAFTWVSSGNLYASGGANTLPYSVGTKSLSAELTQIRLTTSGGTNAFDAGAVNIMFER